MWIQKTAPNRALENVLTEGRNTFGSNPIEVIEMIGFAKGLECTDERNKIYGVLLLAHGWQKMILLLTIP